MSSTLNKKIDSLVLWKRQIENMIADLQRKQSAIELEAPQWTNYVEEQIEPDTWVYEKDENPLVQEIENSVAEDMQNNPHLYEDLTCVQIKDVRK